jgi:imidazole glycerol-phosphate synthase subunit HisH
MITIIDYGSGNLKSIRNGFQRIGAEVKISEDPNEMKEAEALILPGVGAFGKAMENLSEYKDTIHNHIEEGKAFLGVCLGLQVLFSRSQESPGVNGLNIFKGDVVRFPQSLKDEGKKIPHMGWNDLQIRRKCPVLNGVGNDYMYFVHSYYVQPDNEDIVVATVDYGVKVPAVVSQDNVIATQFHPEKSGEIGLNILRNFVKMVF